MIMEKPRKSKRNAVLHDLTDKIRKGVYPPGSEFPTMEDLMLHYKISIGTVGKVIHDLKQLGLIDAAKGRKSRIPLVGKIVPPKLTKPIGVISPASEPFRLSRWRDVVLQLLQREILEDGNQSLWLPEDFDIDQVHDHYAGIIYSGELIPEAQWQRLMDLKIPCARMSFERPYPNTVFIDYRPAMDQIILHMTQNQCRRVIFLASSDVESRGARAWFQKHARFMEALEAYGIEEQSHLEVIPNKNIGTDELFTEITRHKSKVAFITTCSAYTPLIMQLTDKCGMEIHRDFEIYSFSFIENEICIGNNIDLKYTVITEKMMDMFYRQYTTGEQQIGEIIFAEFIPDN